MPTERQTAHIVTFSPVYSDAIPDKYTMIGISTIVGLVFTEEVLI